MTQIKQNSSDNAVVTSQSVIETFQQARNQGIAFELIGKSNINKLDEKNYSMEAKIRITDAIISGKIVMLPSENVVINNASSIGWFEIDPSGGEIMDNNERGEHNSLLEYGATFVVIVGYTGGIGFLLGFVTTLVATSGVALGCYINQCNQKDRQSYKNTINLVKAIEGTLAGGILSLAVSNFGSTTPIIIIGGTIAISEAFLTGLGYGVGFGLGVYVAQQLMLYVLGVDPSIPAMLVGLSTSDPNITTNQSFELVQESYFTLPINGGEFASLYRALIKNIDTKPVTYHLIFPSRPRDFLLAQALPK